jgi:hypothetical protein
VNGGSWLAARRRAARSFCWLNAIVWYGTTVTLRMYDGGIPCETLHGACQRAGGRGVGAGRVEFPREERFCRVFLAPPPSVAVPRFLHFLSHNATRQSA